MEDSKSLNTIEDLSSIAEVLSTPDGYAKIFLGIDLHPVQRDLLISLFDQNKLKSRISFRCANECGKTSIVSTIAILYAIHILNCNVVYTSASYRQVTSQLLPAIRRLSHLYPEWKFLENKIIINNEQRLIAFSAENEATAQGYHNTVEHDLFIITDESAGIQDQIFMAIDRCNPRYLLVTGSPLGPEGIFFAIETEEKMMQTFIHFKLTKWQCLKEDGYWINRSDVEEMINQWGEESALVLSSVYAEFATNILNAIVTLSDIERCIDSIIPRQSGNRHVAIDFAAGGAENVIAYRNGNQVDIIKCWRERDTMLAARQVVEELDKLKISDGLSPSEVSGDADGLGLPIIQRIKELGWNINEWHGNSTAIDENYENRISEAWIAGCRKIKNQEIIFPNDKILKLQLISRKQQMNTRGKLGLESKKDMSARGVPSPDRADAVMMALSDKGTGLLTCIKPIIPINKFKNFF